MPLTRRVLPALALAAIACGGDPAAPNPVRPVRVPAASDLVAANVSDGQGAIWRQLTETVGLSWDQVAAVCPRDGMSPCWATIAGRDLNGWVWATDVQVTQLLARYAPAIATTPTLSGPAADAGVTAFFAAFSPTATGSCGSWTCTFGAFASGWSATSPGTGTAVQASVQAGFGSPSLMQILSTTGVATANFSRGLFMWRPDPANVSLVALDDSGSIDSPQVGVVVPNVLANDQLNGAPATLATVNLATLSSTHAGVTLDAATGAVSVATGVRIGTYTLRYRVCEIALPANCDTAFVTVVVRGNVIDAVDDAGTARTGGGIAVANLLANDLLGGATATLQTVTLRQVTSDPYLALQPGGALRVNAGTPVGTYRITYEICEIANPTNCDQADAVVTVTPYPIDAVNDAGSIPSYPGGTAVPNVLANDTFNGSAATLATVTLSQLSAPAGITLDLTDGSVDVVAGTPGGSYAVTYRICETASPAPGNCDQATATVTVQPQSFVVSKAVHRINEGTGGSFTVRLSQPPTSNVTVAVAYLAGTMNVSFSPAALTFTPANWNVAQTVTFATIRDSDKVDNAGTLTLAAPGIATLPIVVNGIDKDRKGTFPTSWLQAPANGATVSGVISLLGTATSTGGTIVDAKFSVDGNRFATLTGASGTYRPTWSTSTVTNGWHVLEMRTTDSAGNDGRMTIKVFVNN